MTSETKLNDGGPAFPVNELNQQTGNVFSQHMGMTLRDAFALGALSALGDDYQSKPEWIAERSYALADALLSAREVKNGK